MNKFLTVFQLVVHFGTAEPDNTTAQPDANVVSSVSTGRQIAFIVVLPVFFICYGGSCVIYCVHKIYIHCRRSDDEKKWKTLDAIQPSTPARPRIPYPQRLQADKFSKKTMPPPNYPFVYISGSMFKTPPTYEQKKDDGERPATATNIQANIYDQCNDPQGAACAKPVPVVSGRWPGEQSPPVYFQATDEDDIGPMLSNNKFLQQKLAKQSET